MDILRITVSLILLVFVTTGGLAQKGQLPETSVTRRETPPNFKLAFIGDQGLGEASEKVLNLIKSEGAQAVVCIWGTLITPMTRQLGTTR